jgi:hypothetical protein
MDRDYGGVIWTDHSLDRLKVRGIKQGDAWATWKNPDQSRYAKSKGAWIYYRSFGNQKIEVVAKKNEKREWIILSVWSKSLSSNKDDKEQDKSILAKIFNFFQK